MTLLVPSRQAVRERLKTLIETDITEFQAVYDHIPRSLEGYSPACTVSSLGFEPDNRPYRYRYRFSVGIWVRRDLATGVSASEDTLDQMMVKLAQLAIDRAADPTLHILRIPVGQFSETGYPIVDGTPYRVEFVTMDVRAQTGAS